MCQIHEDRLPVFGYNVDIFFFQTQNLIPAWCFSVMPHLRALLRIKPWTFSDSISLYCFSPVHIINTFYEFWTIEEAKQFKLLVSWPPGLNWWSESGPACRSPRYGEETLVAWLYTVRVRSWLSARRSSDDPDSALGRVPLCLPALPCTLASASKVNTEAKLLWIIDGCGGGGSCLQ